MGRRPLIVPSLRNSKLTGKIVSAEVQPFKLLQLAQLRRDAPCNKREARERETHWSEILGTVLERRPLIVPILWKPKAYIPVSLFSYRYRWVRLLRFPSSLGMLPVFRGEAGERVNKFFRKIGDGVGATSTYGSESVEIQPYR